MGAREDLDKLIDGGDAVALLDAARDSRKRSRLQRRILARLYGASPREKWPAVSALGVLAGEEGLGTEKILKLLRHFVWSMSDESGAVPYGIPEALGEILAKRREFLGSYGPFLVSYLIDEELVQTGPILAGVLWALGRAGTADPAEARRALPGIRAALGSEDAALAGSALFCLERLGLAGECREILGLLVDDPRNVCLLVDEEIRETTVGYLARDALKE